jgi:hypothetical protein
VDGCLHDTSLLYTFVYLVYWFCFHLFILQGFLLSFLSHNCIDAVIVWNRIGILGTGCVFCVWSGMSVRLGHGNDSMGDDWVHAWKRHGNDSRHWNGRDIAVTYPHTAQRDDTTVLSGDEFMD